MWVKRRLELRPDVEERKEERQLDGEGGNDAETRPARGKEKQVARATQPFVGRMAMNLTARVDFPAPVSVCRT